MFNCLFVLKFLLILLFNIICNKLFNQYKKTQTHTNVKNQSLYVPHNKYDYYFNNNNKKATIKNKDTNIKHNY